MSPLIRRRGGLLRGVAVAAAICCAYGAGVVSGSGSERHAAVAGGGSVLDEAATKIGGRAAKPVERGDLDRAAIEGMLRRLGDRWAHYYPAREYDDVEGRLTGRYSGVGLWLGAGGRGSRVLVASVQPGGPAARAGVRAGDVITGIGNASVAGWDISRVAGALRGRPDKPVELTVRREHRTERFHLVRTPVSGGDVTVTDLPDHARMIRVGAFTRGTGRDVRAAVTGRSPRSAPRAASCWTCAATPAASWTRPSRRRRRSCARAPS
ncbi:S41 family peptidase [Actinomadura madurae]|uniref:S41 family peptidase n=1 Tax=Actinomadura madurae TaxID=1993 RepID=UPI0020D2607A|nr:PDZ domain-containing protein [Actinomadura madurae]MCQ0008750.1 PDZ domain-containing protein [Actinomadura madurae]MCQ0015930.1 PDZ domain-containing protein [Actinomadura madurae]